LQRWSRHGDTAVRFPSADVLSTGATPVLMCSRHLAATARDADEYRSVYSGLIAASDTPVVLHWLGEVFDPALAGYWGGADLDAATDTVLELLRAGMHRA
jgi:hypothetical protein